MATASSHDGISETLQNSTPRILRTSGGAHVVLHCGNALQAPLAGGWLRYVVVGRAVFEEDLDDVRGKRTTRGKV